MSNYLSKEQTQEMNRLRLELFEAQLELMMMRLESRVVAKAGLMMTIIMTLGTTMLAMLR